MPRIIQPLASGPGTRGCKQVSSGKTDPPAAELARQTVVLQQTKRMRTGRKAAFVPAGRGWLSGDRLVEKSRKLHFR